MPFLNPLLLWGLTFTAVPILLMLLLNRKRLILPWAAYEWMRNAIIRRKRKIQIDDLLKLISKILLIAAIVLIITRPFIRREGARGDALVIVDTSPSMGASYEGGTRLDRTKKMLGNFLPDYESKLALYTFDGKLEPVVAKHTDEKKSLADGLKSLELGSTYSGARTLFEELSRCSALSGTEKIYFVGDFQAHWYGDGPRIVDHMKQLGSGYPMVWHQVDTRADLENCAVETLEITPDGAFLGRECFFNVRVLNGSDQKTGNRVLTLEIDGKPRNRVNMRLEPGERREIPISVNLDKEGWHNIVARIDADPYKEDNVKYAAIHVPPRLRILAVVPTKGDEPFPFDIYVKAALSALLPKEEIVYRSISPLELYSTSLAGVDILLTIKVSLNKDLSYVDKIKEFIERGGGLVAFLPAEHHAEATMFGIEATVSKEPGHVNKELIEQTYLAFMEAPELKPENIEFQKSLIFKDVDKEDTRLVVEAGVNALSRKMGKGRFAVLGFIPYQDYANLRFNPNYVQMILRLFWEARGHRALYSVTGKFEEWHEPWLNRDNTYTLHDEKGNHWNLALDGLGENTRLLIPPDLKFGFYTVKENDKEKLRLGYSIDTGDSHMEPVNEGQLEEPIKEGLTFSRAATISEGLRRIDLLPLAMFLLLAAILLEAYAHFFRKA